MKRDEIIILHSNSIARKLGIKLEDKEINYGKGIGRADNHCLMNGWIIVFEMEFSQRHPEMNVMKVWPYLESNGHKKIFLIHHIQNIKRVSPNRISLSSFIANKIKDSNPERFEYFQILGELDDNKESALKKRLNELKIVAC